jgi:hypothetical protein
LLANPLMDRKMARSETFTTKIITYC